MSGRYLLCIVIGMCVCVCVVCQALKCMSFATGVLIFDGVCSGVSCFLVQAHTQAWHRWCFHRRDCIEPHFVDSQLARSGLNAY